MDIKLKILFADDNQTIRNLTSHVLEQRGHTVQTVTDGDEVIKWLNELPSPDLLITDQNMERMNGLEVLGRLRDDDRFRTLPVIIYTTNDYAEFKFAVKALGGILVNPKTAYNLLAVVDAIAVTIAKERG
ncbi:MAG: response regulator [bacterium]|nr:response regulator [bacterium]